MMSSGTADYEAFDAGVSTNPADSHLEYLVTRAQEVGQAIKKINPMAKGLDQSLKSFKAELADLNARLAAARKAKGGDR